MPDYVVHGFDFFVPTTLFEKKILFVKGAGKNKQLTNICGMMNVYEGSQQ